VKDAVAAAVVAAVTAGSSQHIRIEGALGRGAPFFCQSLSRIASKRFTLNTSKNEVRGWKNEMSRRVQRFMERVSLDHLAFVDLHGAPAALPKYFEDYLLLIFLRHLA
jgi:hypothetical protein